ncbi:MAG TPA: sigma-70 family RNA polymerase sigma factor [Phycisphaerales bacterium]|nr:sigma-70 family RNA polymerase sigma factor [Phycisphaerales bacterium]HMP37826.1 sigma-70 family RNA polymerase sigma factor [Phycisphaerales bacterium]
MDEITRTTTAILDGLREGLKDPAHAEEWVRLDRRYRPLLIGVARRLGLGDADAADAAQEVLASFVRDFRAGRYDRERGRLRHWLLAFLRARVADAHRRRGRAGPSAPMPEEILDERTVADAWEEERRLTLLRAALEALRARSRTDPRTIRVFELLYMHGLAPQAVATECSMSVEEVYVARSRVAARVRQEIRRLDECWDD